MNNTNDSFIQEVLDESEEIYQCISNELRNARSQILVATAWFTEPNLFQHLLDAAVRGVNVRVIIADIDDNKKLDFELLERHGGTVYKVRQSGYRGMRKRFCIVDQRIAINGYSWTVNARINDQESVIVTTLAATVGSLIDQFREMEQAALNPDGPEEEGDFKTGIRIQNRFIDKQTAYTDQNKEEPLIPDKLNFQAEYANVLDRMIAAEVCNFDRGMLRREGYERAEANNGDAQILNSAMDTVYSVFINDINIVEDKKKRLIGKINEQKIVHSGMLENNYQIQLRTIETQTDSMRQETGIRISNLKVKAEVHQLDIKAIKEQKIVAAELEEKEIEEQINIIERDSIVPRFKWYEFIPVTLLSLGLICYLVLFYSSAVYILLFSEARAKEIQANGAIYDAPQVFDPKAFSYIMKEDAYAIGFVCLFIFIPLAMSVISRLAKGSIISKGWVAISLTLLLDTGIAYKVTESIHNARYAAGDTTEIWKATMTFFDSNFYLVFLLGSLGLLIFNALFNKLLSLFEERNPDVHALQLRQKKEQAKEALNKNRAYIASLLENAETVNKELVQVNNDIHLMEMEIAGLPHKKALAIEKCSYDFEMGKRTLSDITIVYIAHIENDILPISIDSMKDRINVFLEGWTSFLNNEYAEAKAIEKSRQAIEAAKIWQQEKLSGDRIDNRIKAL